MILVDRCKRHAFWTRLIGTEGENRVRRDELSHFSPSLSLGICFRPFGLTPHRHKRMDYFFGNEPTFCDVSLKEWTVNLSYTFFFFLPPVIHPSFLTNSFLFPVCRLRPSFPLPQPLPLPAEYIAETVQLTQASFLFPPFAQKPLCMSFFIVFSVSCWFVVKPLPSHICPEEIDFSESHNDYFLLSFPPHHRLT